MPLCLLFGFRSVQTARRIVCCVPRFPRKVTQVAVMHSVWMGFGLSRNKTIRRFRWCEVVSSSFVSREKKIHQWRKLGINQAAVTHFYEMELVGVSFGFFLPLYHRPNQRHCVLEDIMVSILFSFIELIARLNRLITPLNLQTTRTPYGQKYSDA